MYSIRRKFRGLPGQIGKLASPALTFYGLIVLFVGLAPTHRTLAQEPWQIVGGSKYSFVLPERSLNEPRSHLTPPFTLSLAEARKLCPIVTTLYVKIINRLISQNNLQQFIMIGPGVKFAITCSDDQILYGSNIPSGAYATRNNFVVIPSSLVVFLNSEDEIAFIIAHEMSHVLFGHVDHFKALDRTSPEFQTHLNEINQVNEPEADLYGTFLMWNAGYNPYSTYDALANYTKYYLGTLGSILLRLGFDDGHGGSTLRHQKIKGVFQYSNLPGSYSPTPSADLTNAKQEFLKLNTKK